MSQIITEPIISTNKDKSVELKLIYGVSYIINKAPKVFDIYVTKNGEAPVRRRMNATHLVNLYKSYQIIPPEQILQFISDEDNNHPETDLTKNAIADPAELKMQKPYRDALDIIFEQIKNLENELKLDYVSENDKIKINKRLEIAETNKRIAAGKFVSALLNRRK